MSPIAPQLPNGPLTANAHKRVFHSWGLSLLLHVTLTAASLILFWAVREEVVEIDRKGGIVVAMVNEVELETDYLTESVEQSVPEFESTDSDSLSASTAIPDSAVGSVRDESGSTDNAAGAVYPGSGQTPSPLLDVGQLLNSAGSVGLSGRAEMSDEDLRRLEAEQALVAARKPRGEPVSLSVFGSEQFFGRKFVFLLDQSNSMGSGGLGVLDASKAELDREIGKLSDYHQFQIVAYNDGTSMIGKRRLLPAIAENKRLVSGFVDGLVAVGGTEHRGGLMVALGLAPDVIVLISDGGEPTLTGRDLSLVASLANDKTQIHCLQFGAGATPSVSNDFMRKLAEQNNGSFRYIDVSQWKSNK